MSTKCSFGFYKNYELQIVILPTTFSKLEVVIILPIKRFGLPHLLQAISGKDIINLLHRTRLKVLEVEVPKFEIKRKIHKQDVLDEMGIESNYSKNSDFFDYFFHPISTGVIDLTQTISIGTHEGPPHYDYLSYFYLSVNIYKFTADQPFLFALIEDRKKIWFAGQFS
ncbi:unnamed protein product [Thelazia callipaeda]|uniref:SERPIN domain-containing protein n=1 Tax=Thelazia callipaeda TaxID=103827 RepID=A0A0N5CJX4_THECL|nr:unnamed protein product [Thelazia callipaeda]